MKMANALLANICLLICLTVQISLNIKILNVLWNTIFYIDINNNGNKNNMMNITKDTNSGDFVIDGDITYAGQHLLLDLYDCENMSDVESIIEITTMAAKATGATVLFNHGHPFDGGGSSGVIILAESHISWHSWQLERFIAIDIFVCGSCNPYLAIPILEKFFSPGRLATKMERRGITSS